MNGRRMAIGALALVTLGAAGCARDAGTPTGETTGGPTTGVTAATPSPGGSTPPAPQTPVATGDTAEADEVPVGFVVGGEPSVAEPSSDARLTVTQVRVGAHDTYDRVVFEVAGTGTPGWDVRYVDRATDEASGKQVDLSGDGVLQVVVTGTAYPYETGQTEWSAGPITTEGYAQLWEVDLLGTFEARTQAFVGLKDAGVPYRVFSLADPTRVVVDVQH